MDLFTVITVGIFAVVAISTVYALIMLRRVVPTNMVHIVQSKKKTTPYGKGKDAGNVYYEWPAWLPVIGVVVSKFPESVFDISLTDYEAYDSGRLPFMVDVKAFFRIEESETAAQRVSSFDELKMQLQAVLQGAVRRILATDKLESIMEDRSGLGVKFTTEVNSQLKEWGVTTVKSIEFMDIRDSSRSTVIENIMAKEKSRIEMESRIKVAENKREAELKEIDAVRTVDVQRQDAEQQVGLRKAEKDKTVGIANEQANQEIQLQAKITTERNMDVRKVEEVRQAEIQRDVAVVQAEKDQKVKVVNAEADKKVQVVTAEAEKESVIVRAEGEKQSTVVRAEGDLEAAKREAEGTQALGLAKAVAEKALLMAPVDTQITLAKEIGENEGYQQYLVTIKQIEVSGEVGKEMAKAIQNADLKVIANSGDVQSGVGKLGDLFTTTGGTNLTGMLSALSMTEQGKSLVDSVIGRIGGNKTTE